MPCRKRLKKHRPKPLPGIGFKKNSKKLANHLSSSLEPEQAGKFLRRGIRGAGSRGKISQDLSSWGSRPLNLSKEMEEPKNEQYRKGHPAFQGPGPLHGRGPATTAADTRRGDRPREIHRDRCPGRTGGRHLLSGGRRDDGRSGDPTREPSGGSPEDLRQQAPERARFA